VTDKSFWRKKAMTKKNIILASVLLAILAAIIIGIGGFDIARAKTLRAGLNLKSVTTSSASLLGGLVRLDVLATKELVLDGLHDQVALNTRALELRQDGLLAGSLNLLND
jgi:hypothetical protein